jgi:hypothetical protein
MKKLLAVLALPAIFCTLSFTTLSKAPAVPFNNQTTVDINTILVNPCTGEPIQFTGTGHFSAHGVINGNRFSMHSHFNGQGIHGEGLINGTSYTGSEADNSSVNGPASNGAFTITETNSFKMVTSGGGNNFTVKALFHVTVNANGDLTVLVDNFSAECQ